jgi:hypothetical protein
MNSAPNPEAIDPNDALVTRADERLAHAYEQIARADEQLARVTEQLSNLEHDPSVILGRVPSRGRPALRGLIALLLAGCIVVAAFVSQSSYGDAAKLIVARWVPQVILTSSRSLEKTGLFAQPGSSTIQLAAAEPVLPPPTPAAPAAAQDVAPTAAPVSPELAQLLQTMARDLANVEQGIEQLKATQEQMATDNAKAVEQLKASQEQMTRLIAKASVIATPTRKPVPTLRSPQARAQPRAPTQLQPEEQ